MGGSQSTLPTASSLQKAAKTDDIEPVKPIGAPDPTTVQPLVAYGALGHERVEFFRDMTTKIQLSLRCEELAKIAPVFVVVYSRCLGEEHWKELGMSEICNANTKHPVFDPSFMQEFRAEVQCRLRFEVYRVRDPYCVGELVCQKFVGAAEAGLVDVMMARSQGNGWLTIDLMTPKPKVDPPGRIAIWAEEETASKYMVSFTMVGQGLKSTDFWKRKADTYAIVHRTLAIPKNADDDDVDDLDDLEDDAPDLKCTPVYRSEVQRRSDVPRFERVELSSATLCQNKSDQEILIELFDWFRVHRHHYMGEAVITFAELHKASKSTRPLEVPVCIREGPRVVGGRREGSPRGTKDTQRKSTSKSGASKDRFASSSKLSRKSSGSRGFGSTFSSALDKNSRRSTTKDTRTSSQSDGSRTTLRSDTSSTKAARRICGRIVGALRFEDVGVERRYSFLDYIRGGLELRLMVAIDFTRSNVGPHHPESCHYMNGDRPSAYATAIRSVGDVMRSYSSTDKFTAFGFGAKIPPSHTSCSNCFALTGDFFDAEVTGVEGAIRAYQRALHVTRLHGPTKLAEVCRMGANYAAPYVEANAKNAKSVDMLYHVLLILTDGAIDDQLETVIEAAKTADLPISIIVIGIGDEDFSFLEDLCTEVGTYRRMQDAAKPPEPAKQEPVLPAGGFGDPNKRKEPEEKPLKGPTRNIVHFVKYDDFRDKPGDLAAAALLELPREVCGYYTGRNIKPRGLEKLEDDAGNPIPKVIPSFNVGRTKTGSKLPQSRLGTNDRVGSKALALAGGSRSVSMLSSGTHKSSEGGVPLTQKEQQRLKESAQPFFVRAERERLMKEAQSLGYEQSLINRALRNGIASNTLECLVDNIVHGGYGKLPSYKEAAEQAIPEMEVTLPGQPLTGQQGATADGMTRRTGSKVSIAGAGKERSSSQISGCSSHQMDQEIRDLLPIPARARGDSASARTRSVSVTSFAERPRTVSLTSVAEHPKAVTDGGRLRATSSPRSILVSSREGTKDKRYVSKDFKPSFFLNEADGTSTVPLEDADTESKELVLHQSAVPQEESTAIVLHSSGDPQGPQASTEELGVCGICLEAPVNTELLPCQHRVACESCATKLGVICPLCQGTVTEVKKLA